jgi:VCBS repeat-containing protein
VDDVPAAVADSATVNEDSGANAIDVLANDTDIDGGPKTIASVTQGNHGSVVITGDGSGLTYQPEAGYVGEDSFTYTLNGGATATVTVTVGNVDDAPVAVADSATVNEDSGANAIDVLANDTDIDGGPKSIASVTQGSHGTVVITGDGIGLTYQPEAGYVGEDSFTYTLNGGATATVTVTVGNVDDAPVAVADSATVGEDSGPNAIDVLGNDTDVDGGPRTIASVTQGSHGSVAITGDGAGLTYTPDADYFGEDTFTYALNGGSVATVKVTVNGVAEANSIPVASRNTGAILAEGGSGAITAAELDFDDAEQSDSALTYTITAATTHGTLFRNGVALALNGTFTQADISNGLINYSHDGGETLADAFGFTVSDGAGGEAPATFTLTVTAVNDAPVNTVPGTQTIEANTSAAITGLSIADADAGSGTLTTTLTVLHGTLVVTSAGGAAVAGSGTDSVTLTGTLAQINATLAAANSVVYHGAHDVFGPDSLTVTTNDGGNSGADGARSDTDQVAIDLTTWLIGTADNDRYTALPGNERIDGGYGNDSVTFGFKLTDATVSYEGNKVVIDGPSGSHTVLTGFETFVFTDGTVNNADENRLVDDLFYYSQNHDVWQAGVGADEHYMTFGWKEHRDPSAFFSTVLYLSANPDVAAMGLNPLAHYAFVGWQEGRMPSLGFDGTQYLADNPDVAAAHVDPLFHFLTVGAGEGREPTGLDHLVTPNGFDYAYYLENNPDVAAAAVDPYIHFETTGWKEGRNPNAYFDTAGYLATYDDVKAAGINPLDHYHLSGWLEGRDPSLDFDTNAYLAANPDAKALNGDPLIHFLEVGIREGRSAQADGVWG